MADENDITYTRDFYNQEDCSLSLLKSKEIADLSLFERQKGVKFSTRNFE